MTITLSDETWQNLAREYFGDFRNDAQAIDSANRLADHLALLVDGPSPDLQYLGVLWTPVQNSEPYDGLASLSEAIYQDGESVYATPVQVSDLYHDHPVFTRDDNLRFRVWHDTGHYLRQQGFDRAGELELFTIQAQQLAKRPLIDALFSESVYQLAASITLGTFPDKQYVRTPGPVGRALLDAWGL